jgi:hypothetical protein
MMHYHRECDFETPCVCYKSRSKDFYFQRFSVLIAELIKDASSLGCYAVSPGKRFGAEFCLRFVLTIYQSTRRKIQENANSNILNYVNSMDHVLGVAVFTQF